MNEIIIVLLDSKHVAIQGDHFININRKIYIRDKDRKEIAMFLEKNISGVFVKKGGSK